MVFRYVLLVSIIIPSLTFAQSDPNLTFERIFKHYGNNPFTLKASSNNTEIPIKYSIIESSLKNNCIVLSGENNENVEIKNAGSVIVRAHQDANEYYSEAEKTASITILQSPITVNSNDATKVYGDEIDITILELSLTGFKNGDTENDLDIKPTLNINADLKSNVGEYPIYFSGGKDDNYFFVEGEQGILNITKRYIVASIRDQIITYGENPDLIEYNYSNLPSFEISPSFDTPAVLGTLANNTSPPGIYNIDVIKEATDNNYEIKTNEGYIQVKKRPIQLSVMPSEKIYGEENPDFVITYSSNWVNGDSELSIDSLPIPICNVDNSSSAGKYPVGLFDGFDDKYDLDLKSGELMIKKREITITAPDIHKVYGNGIPNLRSENIILGNNFVNGDNIDDLDEIPEIIVNQNYSGRNLPAGNYPGVIELAGGDDNNYSYMFKNGNLTVEKAPLNISSNECTKVFGEPIDSIKNFKIFGLMSWDDVSSLNIFSKILVFDSSNQKISDELVSYINAGDYNLKFDTITDANYYIHATEGILSVVQAPLYFKIKSTTIKYGDDIPNITYDYDVFGFKLNNDLQSEFIIPPKCSVDAGTTSIPGVYPINFTYGVFKKNNYIQYPIITSLVIEKVPFVINIPNINIFRNEKIPKNIPFDYEKNQFKYADNLDSLDFNKTLRSAVNSSNTVGKYPINFISGKNDDCYSIIVNDAYLTIHDSINPILSYEKQICENTDLLMVTSVMNGDNLSYRWEYKNKNDNNFSNSFPDTMDLLIANDSLTIRQINREYENLEFRCIVTNKFYRNDITKDDSVVYDKTTLTTNVEIKRTPDMYPVILKGNYIICLNSNNVSYQWGCLDKFLITDSTKHFLNLDDFSNNNFELDSIYVIATDINTGCYSKSYFNVIPYNNSDKTPSNIELEIYPNPNNGNFGFTVSGLYKNIPFNYYIIKTNGTTIQNKNIIDPLETMRFSINKISEPGIYFLSVSQYNRRITKQIFVNN